MFGIGLGELLLITALGIVILGPKRCADLARSAGKLWGKAQRELENLKKEFTHQDEPPRDCPDGNDA